MEEAIYEQDRSDEVVRRLGLAAVQLCTIDETCKLLRVSRWQVNDLLNRREVGSVKIGRRRLVPLADLQAYLDRTKVGAVA